MASPNPATPTHRVGSIPILSLFDGTATYDAREILTRPGAAEDAWAAHADALADDGRTLELTMGAYLVISGDRRILVDAGLGTIETETYSGGAMLDSLRTTGYETDDITDVLLTHLHFDHVGWTTRKGEVVFDRAVYRCHAADWAHFVEAEDADDKAVRKLTPFSDQLELFDDDRTIAPGVDVRHAPGHTPGSVIVVVSDGPDRALLIGDIAHCPAELTEDEWEAVFDVDRDLARRTREALARELEDSGAAVVGAHFPGLEFGRLLPGEGRRSWVLG